MIVIDTPRGTCPPRENDNASGSPVRSRVRCRNSFIIRDCGGVAKSFTPNARCFSRVFHYFTSQSLQNHDFYPTDLLHGGFIAMYTESLAWEQ